MMTPFDVDEDMLPMPSAIEFEDRVLFDIDPYKENMDHISYAKDDETIAEITLKEQEEEEVYYKPLPTSESLNRMSTVSTNSSTCSSVSFNEDLSEPKVSKLPAMDEVIRNLGIIQQRQATSTTEQKPAVPKRHMLLDDSFEAPEEVYGSDIIRDVDMNNVPVNLLGPREQEEADEGVRRGMKYLFDNKFMKAKALFQTKSDSDPLYALGLGAMTFIKAMMTYNTNDVKIAMDTLTTTYNIAHTQTKNLSIKKKPATGSFSTFFSSFLTPNQTGLPTNPPIKRSSKIYSVNDGPKFIPNGILRATVIKAECCLLMGMLQMTEESVLSYIKCGLNLKRSYDCYTFVWQEYKRMGQEYTRHMDRDTVSAIQFGIGTVHLLVSSLPPKILKIFARLGFKSDKQLGFALLKLCLEEKGIRAPLASLVLLSYYSILSSFAPQLYTKELMGSAVECLLEAQKSHPSSCFFLFYAGRISRIAGNLPLSTQSFTFALEASRGEWAEGAMTQMGNYEMGFNAALELDWIAAESYFEKLSQDKYYWSPAFCQYFIGACRAMLGKKTESILSFAEVPLLANEQPSNKKSYIDTYVQQKVEFFRKSGYQDLDFSLPGLELLLVWNAYDQMRRPALEGCLLIVQSTLELLYEREKLEYHIRLTELVPSASPPNYYDQRAILLLIKASVLNALKRHKESIAHLNWIMDHKQHIKYETWVIPFTYWEAGVTSWGMGNYAKSRAHWESALACTKYTFEYRMAVRLSLALCKCDEVGAPIIKIKKPTGLSTNGRKRMPIMPC